LPTKILVTGGLGFIGSNFIRHIFQKRPGTYVLNIDKIGIGANPANLNDIKKHKNYRFIKGDISEPKVLKDSIKKVDVIFNFAAETHVDRSITHPEQFIKSNIVGTFNLLESIRKQNREIEYIQISTDEVYGEILEGSSNEQDRLACSNPYSASKASADMLCLAYHRTYGLNVKISRCTNNFGPFQFPEKLIPKTIIRALKNFKTPIYGTGKNSRDWIYVIDHCDALLHVQEKGRNGEIYNISSGNILENIHLAKTILKILAKPDDLIAFVEDRPGHDFRYSLDSSKIRSELSWNPKHEFYSSLEKTVNWYKNNESWWKPLSLEKVLHSTPWKTE